MKTWPQKLREMPLDLLRDRIAQQAEDIERARRDLETMKRVLEERLGNIADK